MNIYFSDLQLQYNPQKEFSGREFRDYPEKPDRIKWILDTIEKENNDNLSIINPPLCKVEKIINIHDKGYVDFLQSIPKDIEEQVPMTLAPANIKMVPDLHSLFQAQLGYYFYSVDTPITGYSFVSAHHSVSSAISCVNQILGKENISISLSRPPGHHAMYNKGGGYCFFNNIAIAAQEAVSKGKTVSILDLDYHHGNGTQELFYTTSKVQYSSIHSKNAYPYYWGGIKEIGSGDGKYFNQNYPIPNTTNSENYDSVLLKAIKNINEYNPDILLVSMGFDCYYKDPIAGMQISMDYFQRIGHLLSDFSKVGIILEGGYSKDIGDCFIQLIRGLDNK